MVDLIYWGILVGALLVLLGGMAYGVYLDRRNEREGKKDGPS